MLSIGWRNLKRDPWKFGVCALGVTFAVVLVTSEVGMLLGLVRNASLLIDNSRADLWVSTVDVETFDFATPIEQRKKYLIAAVPGVESVEEFNVSYSSWKLPSGGNSNVQVIALDLRGGMAPPLNLVEGSIEALHNQNAVIIDEADRGKLGDPKLGDLVEIMNHQARVVGFTRGMKSFTTTPFVFTSLRNGRRYGYLMSDQSTGGRERSVYFLVKARTRTDVQQLRQRIAAAVQDVEVHTRESFSWRTRSYWMLETGVGPGFLVAGFLGVLVGGVIVSQTLYAATLEKLPEYGVLLAMGATMKEVSRVVLEQGFICGAVGLAVGLPLCCAISDIARACGAAIEVPWLLIACVTLLVAVLCAVASLTSILRLGRIEPANLFRT